MGTLRITIDSLKDAGSTPIDGVPPGDTIGAVIYMVPGITRGMVIDEDGGMHSAPPETVRVSSWPWAHDLTDPTGTRPTDPATTTWGWTVTIRPQSGPPAVADLTAETIAALPQVDGVRTARLEDHIRLG